MNITVKTIGNAPTNNGLIEVSSKQVADAIQSEISGGKATQNRVDKVTQEFCDKHMIAARYHSGTFLGFKISDEASDEFSTFPR